MFAKDADTTKPADSKQTIRREMIPDYSMLGAGGGRGGLPEVTLYVKRNQVRYFWHGPGGYLDDTGVEPKNMNYPGWNFWQLGVWDALMQLVCEQATDPSGKPVKLGKFHHRLRGSSTTCWTDSKQKTANGLVLDLSKEVPLTESFRSDHYVTYGRNNRLYFNGTARMHVVVERNGKVTADVMQSTMPEEATKNLKASIESLSAHPVISFPVRGKKMDKMEMIAEFAIRRKPGELAVVQERVKKGSVRPQ